MSLPNATVPRSVSENPSDSGRTGRRALTERPDLAPPGASMLIAARYAREHPPRFFGRYGFYLLHDQEQAHADEQGRDEEVGSCRSSARGVQRNEDAAS